MPRPDFIDAAEQAEIEADLDELDALLRAPRPARRRAIPAAGGGEIAVGRKLHNGLRPRPAAFARAIADGLKPIPAAFRAGYGRVNRMTCWRLMRDPKVIAEIARLVADPGRQS